MRHGSRGSHVGFFGGFCMLSMMAPEQVGTDTKSAPLYLMALQPCMVFWIYNKERKLFADYAGDPFEYQYGHIDRLRGYAWLR